MYNNIKYIYVSVQNKNKYIRVCMYIRVICIYIYINMYMQICIYIGKLLWYIYNVYMEMYLLVINIYTPQFIQ